MARIRIPEGEGDEIYRVWSLCPELGEAVANLSATVYGAKCKLPARVREAARMKIAHINGCQVCMGWRIPELAKAGVTEELYAHVGEPRHAEYSAQESLAIEYAEKFAADHHSIDDAFFARHARALLRRRDPRALDPHRRLARLRAPHRGARPRRGLRLAPARGDGLKQRSDAAV